MLHVSLGISLLAAGVSPQEPVRSTPPTIEAAWRRFVETNGENWVAHWDPATGTPRAIWGPGRRLQPVPIDDLDAARHHATAELDRWADLLGRGETTFVESIGAKVRGVYVLVYDQRYAGLPVLGGRADVRIHDAGVLSMLGSSAVPIAPGFETTPAIGVGRARSAALDHVGGAGRDEGNRQGNHEWPPVVPRGRLVIWADLESSRPAHARLAWEIPVDRRGPDPVVGRVYVDARTADVIEFRNDMHTCGRAHDELECESAGCETAAARDARTALLGTVNAWVNAGRSPLDARTLVPVRRVKVRALGVGDAFTDDTGAFRIPYAGTGAVTLSVDLGVDSSVHVRGGIRSASGVPVSRTVQATSGVPVQITLGSAGAPETAWSQTTVRHHVDDANVWLRSLVGSTSQMDRLSNLRGVVNIEQTCNAFYTNFSVSFFQRGGACNMTGYSSIVYHEWGHGLDDVFGGISQVDGLSEGYADIVANFRLNDPVVGQNFYTDGSFVRTARNTRTYPPGGFPPGGAPHPKGEVWMGFAWDLRDNLIQRLGWPAGTAHAARIVIGSIVANPRNQPDAVREVFLLDDDDGNLINGTPHYAELEAAALRRLLPYPARQLLTISHNGLGDTPQDRSPRIVRAVVRPNLGSVSAAHLVYDTGSGPVRRPMVRSGASAVHQWIALVPPVASPAIVAYRIEARHSSGLVIRHPEQGDLTYRVGTETVFFREDFEVGSNGWTHAGQLDEWEQGAPAGRGGSSSGLSWSDPITASSGTRVWGTDLGLAGDGAYESFSNSALSSPVLDLTGRTGVRLRYDRWLSASLVDNAFVLANTSVLWHNTSTVTDLEWVTEQIDLSAFDNQPAVQLHWALFAVAPFRLGGWNIDDVRLSSFGVSPPPAVTFRIAPAQVGLGQVGQLSIAGAPRAVVAVLLSASPGPTEMYGLTLQVGANHVTVVANLDANGSLTTQFRAPGDAGSAGSVIYAQVVMATANRLEVSNPMIVLFGP